MWESTKTQMRRINRFRDALNIQERAGKKYGHVTRRDDEYVGKRVMRTDVYCQREEKERKTEAEVDGQCACGLESDEDGCGLWKGGEGMED